MALPPRPDPALYRRIAAEFEVLCDLSVAERVPRLAELRREQPELADQVERMLAADDHTTGVFQTGMTGAGSGMLAADLADEEPPQAVGPFTIVRELGRGGMGVVYEAQQAHPRRRVALKTLHPWLRTEQAAALFRFEAQALGDLLHPGIPQVYAADEADGLVYLVMELVRGQPLDRALGASVDLDRRVRTLARICDAVQHAHDAGILHRDLKPQNILVTADGQPKVLDFGIAGTLLESRAAQAAGAVGTLAYASPEQLRGQPTDVSTDVYALGVLGYELFTGVLPHDVRDLSPSEAAERKERPALPMRARRPELPADLGWILDRALEPAPGDRPASVGELAADLRRVLRLEPLPGRPGLGYRLGLGLRRNRSWVLGAVALAGVGLLGWAGSNVSDRLEAGRRAATAEQRRVVLDENLDALAAEESPDWGAIEAGFDSFASLPEVHGTPALAVAWLGHAERRRRGGRGEVLEALVKAWVLASDEATTVRAAGALARELADRGQHDAALATLDSLEPARREPLRELEWKAAVATRNLDRALALLPEGASRQRGPLQALSRTTPLGLRSVGAVVLPLGEPAAPVMVTIERENHVVLRRPDASEVFGRLDHPDGFGVRAAQLFAFEGDLFLATDAETLPTGQTRLFRARIDPGTGAPQPWEEVADLGLGSPTATQVVDLDGPEVILGLSYPKRRLLRVGLRDFEVQPGERGVFGEQASDLPALDLADLDGDGVPELIGSSTDWSSYEVRAWRITDDDLARLDSERLGFVPSVARLEQADGPDRIAAFKVDLRRLPHLFGEEHPYGPPQGLYVLGLEQDRLVRKWHVPVPPAAREWPNGDRLLIGDLDGDGRLDGVISVSDFSAAQQTDLLVFSDVASPDAEVALLQGIKANALFDVDGDGDMEVVATLGGEIVLLGTGDAVLPPVSDSGPSVVGLGPVPAADPTTVRTWDRAARLADLGLWESAADALVELAKLHERPSVRASARHEGALLYERAGEDGRAAATWIDALVDAADPDLERRIRAGAVRSSVRTLDLEQAWALADAANRDLGEPWLERAAASPTLEMLGPGPLDPRWQVHQPGALTRDVTGWTVDGFNGDDLVLSTEVDFDGPRLGLAVDLSTTHLESGLRVVVSVVDAAGEPVLGVSHMASTGGGAVPSRTVSCLAGELEPLSVVALQTSETQTLSLETEWLADPGIRVCQGVGASVWRELDDPVVPGRYTLRLRFVGDPALKTLVRARVEIARIALTGVSWPEPAVVPDLARGRHLLASDRFTEALELLDGSPKDQAVAFSRLGDVEAMREPLRQLAEAGETRALGSLYRSGSPALQAAIADALGPAFPAHLVDWMYGAFTDSNLGRDKVAEALDPGLDRVDPSDPRGRMLYASRAEVLFRDGRTHHAVRLARIAAYSEPDVDPTTPTGERSLRRSVYFLLASFIAQSEPEEALDCLRRGLDLATDRELQIRQLRHDPALGPLVERLGEAERLGGAGSQR